MFARRTAAAAAALMLALGTGVASAQGTTYRLESGQLTTGCLPPCLCAIFLEGDVQGTFVLEKKLVSQFGQTFAVKNVNWTVVALNGTRKSIKGEGTYTRTTPLIASPTEQLVLTLSIDGGPKTEFDSGPLVDSGGFPDIALSIADNDFVCLNQVISLDASPVPPSEILTYELVGSSLQEGCFPPCLCPLFTAQRVFGTFDLVLLSTDGLFTEYSVSNVAFKTGPTTFSDKRNRIRGFGTYTVLEGSGPVPIEEMTLCLVFNGIETDPFTSGPVAQVGPVDGISLVLTQHELFCLDRVLDLNAVQVP